MKKILTSIVAAFMLLSTIGLGNAKAATETEPNDSYSQATALQFTNTTGNQYKATVNSVIQDYWDDDYYRFTLSKAGNIAFKISQRTGTKFEVTLKNADGDTLDSYSTDYGSSTVPITLFSEGLDRGTYYVIVEYYDGSYDENIPYSLELGLTQSDYYEKEDNDDYSEGNQIILNSVYKGYADSSSDDYFSFNLTEKGEVKVDLTPSPTTRFLVYIYNSQGEEMEGWYTYYDDNTKLSNVIYLGLPAGKYFVRVKAYDGETDNVPYQLKVSFKANNNFEAEENDSLASSNLISLNTQYGAVLRTSSDYDYYRLNLTKKTNLSMYLTRPSDARLYVEIFDQSEDTYHEVYTSYGKGSLDKITDLTLNKGTYYIRINHYDGDVSQLPYKFKIVERDMTPPGKPKVNSITDKSTSISGSTEANATVYLKDNKKLSKSVKADKNGKFKLSISKIKGDTKLYITAKDASGNQSSATVITVKDTTAPLGPKVDKVTTKTTYVTGKAEVKAKVVIKVGSKVIGQGNADSKGAYKIKISKQKQNSKLSIYAIDASKNTSKATSVSVKDATAPAAPKVDKVTTKTANVTGKAEEKAKVVIKVGKKVIGQGSASSKGTFKVKIAKQKKGAKLLVYAVDTSKNTSNATVVYVK